ncbi:15272_t:CDS:2 [Acaulospora morrowiae]|uniref:F-actin-capping protein subunit alpha n=1 Tax=Acaulospora morrowiae TaxID=94023 RepID=A0A9N8YK34_9GLOM|nr:15272_t:CDS:2 [Acaulospora morrowiae]
MDELNVEEKLKIVSGFLLESPPGEINDVYNGMLTFSSSSAYGILMGDDEEFDRGIKQALRQYNTEQYVTATLPGQETKVIVSKFGQIEEDLYLDPKSQQTFKFDHLLHTVTDVQPYTVDETTEHLRSTIETAISDYITDHYPDGVSTVYYTDGTYTVAIVDDKFNPQNLWNGKWRSTWVISPDSDELKGTIKVNVHYYEDGNVQLNSSKEIEITASASSEDPAERAAAYVKSINKAEEDYQSALNESYLDLSENTFKGLRRALPLTRHKIDWDKVLNYKIGQELATKATIE